MPVNSSLTLPVCVVSARKYRAAATLYAVLTAIAPQTLCTVAACESFRTLDMPKRLKHFVNVQLKVDRSVPTFRRWRTRSAGFLLCKKGFDENLRRYPLL
jgi:hypothetical protein